MSQGNPLEDPRKQAADTAALLGEQAWHEGRREDARTLFAKAAELEEVVAREAPADQPRLRSILAIGAVANWYKASDLDRAKRLAYLFLADGDHLTEQGRRDLEELVDRCSREADLARITGDPTMIPVEMKLDGGRVGFGIAPAPAARARRDRLLQLLMRSADLLAHQEYREQGESDLQRGEKIQLFETPARAASYGLRFYVATGAQQTISSEGEVTPEQVVEHFLSVASAAEQGPDEVRRLVKDDQYARSFIEGFGDIAPDGEDVARVSCSSPTWRLPSAPRLMFERRHRDALRAAIPQPTRPARPGEMIHEGKLLGIHALGSDRWISLEVADARQPRVVMMKDARLIKKVGTLYEQGVRVFVWRPPSARGREFLADIEPLTRQRSLPNI